MKRENGKHIACSARPVARPLRAQLFTSVLAVVLCCALLCASTFAWFTANASATVSEIKAAEFGMTIMVNGNNLSLTKDKDYLTGSYTFSSASAASFTIKATGQGNGGFCIISWPTTIGGTSYTQYYTQQISSSSADGITLTINAGENVTIYFYCIWGDPTTYNNDDIAMLSMNGSSEAEEMRLYGDGDTIVFAGAPEDDTPFVWYALVAGITVEDLAAYYGVSVDYILEYNHLASLADVGDSVKVPNPNGINLPFIPDADDEDESDEEKTDEDESDEDGEAPTDETDTPEPSDTPTPEDTPEPSDTPAPEDTPEPSDTPAPEDTPEPSDTPAPEDTPEPSDTPAPEDTPEPSDTPAPEDTPEPEDTPAPVSESESPAEPEPEVQPQTDATPAAVPDVTPDTETPTETE